MITSLNRAKNPSHRLGYWDTIKIYREDWIGAQLRSDLTTTPDQWTDDDEKM